jgi:hypothetical protein
MTNSLKRPFNNHWDYCNAMEEVMKAKLAEQAKAKADAAKKLPWLLTTENNVC